VVPADALAGEAREAALVQLARREGRILDDDAGEALLAQADCRLRDAHVRLAADEDDGRAAGGAHGREDLRRAG
jgi:hypothetical protein